MENYLVIHLRWQRLKKGKKCQLYLERCIVVVRSKCSDGCHFPLQACLAARLLSGAVC